MKPFLSALALSGAFVISNSAFAGGPTLLVSDESGQVNTTVVVDVDYTSNGASRGGDFQLNLTNAAIFSAISIECGDVDQTSGGLVNVCNYNAGVFDIGQANLADPLASGNLARLSFTIDGTANPNDVATIVEGAANNWEGGLIISAGSVTVNAGPAPNLGLSGNGNFGAVEVGSTANSTFTLTNNGDPATSLSVTDISFAGADFSAVGGTCAATPFNLATGASCTVIGQFSPAASGASAGSLDVTSAANNESIALSGTGTAAQPVFTTSNTTPFLEGADVGVNVSAAIGASNTGPAATRVEITACTIDSDPSGSASFTPATATLNGGDSQSFTLSADAPVVGASYVVEVQCSTEEFDSDGVSIRTGTIDITGTVSTRPAVIPTLGAFGLVLITMLMGLIGLVVVRQRA
jgi:hypothetical protein